MTLESLEAVAKASPSGWQAMLSTQDAWPAQQHPGSGAVHAASLLEPLPLATCLCWELTDQLRCRGSIGQGWQPWPHCKRRSILATQAPISHQGAILYLVDGGWTACNASVQCRAKPSHRPAWGFGV